MAKIKLNNVRLSFPSVFKRAEFNGEQGKFEATFLMNEETQADLIKKLETEIDSIANDHFKGKVPKSIKLCLQSGSEKDYDGYDGHMSLKAASNKRPTVIGRDKTPLVEDDNVLYAGCYVNAIIDFWVQDNSFGKRVNANLLGIQFFAEGTPFGSGDIDVTDDFDEVDDNDF